MKNHPAYIAARQARRRDRVLRFVTYAGALILLLGSFPVAISSGEGDILLIAIPLSIYLLIGKRFKEVNE